MTTFFLQGETSRLLTPLALDNVVTLILMLFEKPANVKSVDTRYSLHFERAYMTFRINLLVVVLLSQSVMSILISLGLETHKRALFLQDHVIKRNPEKAALIT